MDYRAGLITFFLSTFPVTAQYVISTKLLSSSHTPRVTVEFARSKVSPLLGFDTISGISPVSAVRIFAHARACSKVSG